jgi:hypothetical protein
MQKIAAFATIGLLAGCWFGKSVLNFICVFAKKAPSYLSRWVIAMGYWNYRHAPGDRYVSVRIP